VSAISRRVLPGWRSRTTFVMALAVSAVGLGNLWRFSWLAGKHGGGAFVVSYVLCLMLIVVPLMVAEVALGMHGRGSPVTALRRTAVHSGLSHHWQWLGVLAVVTGLLVSAYYSVIAGWALAYAEAMQAGVFSSASAMTVAEHLTSFLQDADAMAYWLTVFLAPVLLISAGGVRRGLGLLVWLLVPGIIVLLYVLVDYALRVGELDLAQDFLFSVKWVDFTWQTFFLALQQAFFTLAIGVGVGIMFGAYAPQRVPIFRSVMAVALFDTLVALAAGVAVFPVIFAHNMQPYLGPGLLFISVPYGYGNMAQGELFGALYFALVALVALGSTVALLEPAVAWVIERSGWPRVFAVVLVGALVWALGLLVVGSISMIDAQSTPHLLQQLDAMSTGVLIPLVVLLTAVFVGWRIGGDILRIELYRESATFFPLWRLFLRYIAPLLIVVLVLV